MKLTRGILTMAAVLLATPVQAQARVRHHHHHRPPAAADVQPALGIPGAAAWFAAHAPRPCPAGVPVQAITLVDQTGQSPTMLMRVERAIVDQSMQVRAAWGTPCVTFAPGGWPLYLVPNASAVCNGAPACHGPNGSDGVSGEPAMWIGVGRGQLPTVAISHEVLESLVDPTLSRMNGSDSTAEVEICDPVSEIRYQIDGVWVSDWTTPHFWSHPFADRNGDFAGALDA